MSVPLATLRRDTRLVWLYDALSAPPPAEPGARASRFFTSAHALDPLRGERVEFRDAAQAQQWLGHWRADPSAMLALRFALQRAEPSAPLGSWTDDHLLTQLAGQLARRAVVAVEGLRAPAPAVLPAAPPPPAVVEPPSMSLAQLLAPVPTPPPALLPVLEEVQIEGAEVLPEIEQSLEQVDLSIGEIGSVSLEPAPSKVPDIEKAMNEAAAGAQADLGKL